VLDFDGSRRVRRREAGIAVAILAVAFLLFAMPTRYQEPVRRILRRTVLRPFIAMQARVAARRARSVDLVEVRGQRDSLWALVAAQTTLSEENRRLRALLNLRERAGQGFLATQVLRLGVEGADGTFMIDAGASDSVAVGSPVLAPEGLLGLVRDVDGRVAQALDWTHSDFRASAMTADGDAYGIVEPQRGRYREDDMLLMTGAPFHSDIKPGTRIVTSGRGVLFPRGIPIGTVVGIDEADTGWRKSYLIQPAVRPEEAVHVLVGLTGAGRTDLSRLWNVPATIDTISSSTASPATPAATPPTDTIAGTT
jgi:rod shape-determining protein MreC